MGKLLRGFFFFGLVLTMGCGDSQENTRVAGEPPNPIYTSGN